MRKAGSAAGSLRRGFSPANMPLVVLPSSIYSSERNYGSLDIALYDQGRQPTNNVATPSFRQSIPWEASPACLKRTPSLSSGLGPRGGHWKPPWRALRFESPLPKGRFLLCFSSAVLKIYSAGTDLSMTGTAVTQGPAEPAGVVLSAKPRGSRLRPVCAACAANPARLLGLF